MPGKTPLAQNELPGLTQSGQYQQGILGSISQPGPIRYSPDTIYLVGTYPLNTPELIRGEGLEITQTYCRFCHSTTYISMQPQLSASAWHTIVDKMIHTHGAPIPEEEAKQIIAYLQAQYAQKDHK
ncbi:MAG: sulfide dehydrogenase [wastewater metagenome]|nr:sulfide dehydrogenase [Candidatus Loosdrechtia aerotolerans]